MRGQAVVFSTLAACGGFSEKAGRDAAPTPDAPPVGRIDLGSNDLDFQPLLDGGPIQLTMGRQGGYHVYLTLRAQNLDLPAGRILEGQRELAVKTKGEVTSTQSAPQNSSTPCR